MSQNNTEIKDDNSEFIINKNKNDSEIIIETKSTESLYLIDISLNELTSETSDAAETSGNFKAILLPTIGDETPKEEENFLNLFKNIESHLEVRESKKIYDK